MDSAKRNSSERRASERSAIGTSALHKKRDYVHVDIERRVRFIQLALAGEMSVRHAAKEIGIKYTTARHILRVYKETGHVESLSLVKRRHKQAQKQTAEQLMMALNNISFDHVPLVAAPPINYTLTQHEALGQHQSLYCTCDEPFAH